MISPLEIIEKWISEEKNSGNNYPEGAVLSTVSKSGIPRSRVVGTSFDKSKVPLFFTSPTTRKVADIEHNKSISLTYSFQNSFRSISIEGTIKELKKVELEEAWKQYDEDFRKHYLVFGKGSGDQIRSLDFLRKQRDKIDNKELLITPEFFIGYKFDLIERVSFYSVIENNFALNEVYIWNKENNTWDKVLLIP